VLACKEKRLNQLTEENMNLKMFTRKLQEIITNLQIQLDKAQPVVRMRDLENEESMNSFISSL
jgi:predicted RNase H-like nuclease (RuvC/YqgF family)